MKAPERSLAPIWGAKSGNYKATMRGDNASAAKQCKMPEKPALLDFQSITCEGDL